MKRLIVLVCAVALLVPVVFAPQAGAGAGVKGVKDCGKLQNRPHRIVLACGDFSLFINTIHWNKWKKNGAVGTGFLQQNNCSPNCASGTFNAYPVIVSLYAPKKTKCGNKTANIFRKYSLDYTGALPPNADALDQGKIPCG